MDISIHALHEEGDTGRPCRCCISPYFYPRPPRGGRQIADSGNTTIRLFLSTPSARRATCRHPDPSGTDNFYPRPPRGGRPLPRAIIERRIAISIHALREEGDSGALSFSWALFLFLSTPSARRATSPPISMAYSSEYFYPRPPRGGRPIRQGLAGHAKAFLSTPSARRATINIMKFEQSLNISIHALREEGDHIIQHSTKRAGQFLSTPSVRRATDFIFFPESERQHFYPRPP